MAVSSSPVVRAMLRTGRSRAASSPSQAAAAARGSSTVRSRYSPWPSSAFRRVLSAAAAGSAADPRASRNRGSTCWSWGASEGR